MNILGYTLRGEYLPYQKDIAVLMKTIKVERSHFLLFSTYTIAYNVELHRHFRAKRQLFQLINQAANKKTFTPFSWNSSKTKKIVFIYSSVTRAHTHTCRFRSHLHLTAVYHWKKGFLLRRRFK